jgi:hypothetical protein
MRLEGRRFTIDCAPAGSIIGRALGLVKAFGEFRFSCSVYGAIREFVEEYCEPTAKQEAWGVGFRNKREVVRKCLPKLNLSLICFTTE